MKSRIALTLFLLTLTISGCEKKEEPAPYPVPGLSLYWGHEVFGPEGRRLRFTLYSTIQYESLYELVFKYSIEGNSITVRLVDMINNGDCGIYDCDAQGGFYIKESELKNGIYNFKVITPNFTVDSELTITDEVIVLNVPANSHFGSAPEHFYPTPKDIFFGSVNYQGAENTPDAVEYLEALENLGLTKLTLPDHPYNGIRVDENGEPIEEHTEGDFHSIGFIYEMNTDFETIWELSEEHFHRTKLNMMLMSSNGNEGWMYREGDTEFVHMRR